MTVLYVYTRMHGEFLEFFPEFFDLTINNNQIFFCKELSEVGSGHCIILHYFMYFSICFVLQ